jgi:hypothetical protein
MMQKYTVFKDARDRARSHPTYPQYPAAAQGDLCTDGLKVAATAAAKRVSSCTRKLNDRNKRTSTKLLTESSCERRSPNPLRERTRKARLLCQVDTVTRACAEHSTG